MSRYARKVDANHGHVVAALRQVGAWVWSTAAIGGGFPDLLVWHRGRYTLLEVKDGAKPPSARALTDAERAFLETCPGRVFVVNSAAEAVAAVAMEVAP